MQEGAVVTRNSDFTFSVKNYLTFFFEIYLCVRACVCVCMCAHTYVCVCASPRACLCTCVFVRSTYRGQKWASDPLELELQVVVIQPSDVDAGE